MTVLYWWQDVRIVFLSYILLCCKWWCKLSQSKCKRVNFLWILCLEISQIPKIEATTWNSIIWLDLLSFCLKLYHSFILQYKRSIIVISLSPGCSISLSVVSSIVHPPSRLQVSDLYCSACECAVCEDCVPDHEDHAKVPLSEALEQHRSTLQERLGAVQNRYGSWWHGEAAVSQQQLTMSPFMGNKVNFWVHWDP